MQHPVHLGSDTQNSCPPPPLNVTIKASSDLPWTFECLPPKDKTRLFCLARPSHKPTMYCSFRNYLATSAHFRFHSRIVESFNLFDFTSIFTQNTTRSCSENRGNLQWKNSRADQLSSEIMIKNSYSFRKQSFGTIYWLTSDPGSGVWGICLELSNISNARIHRASSPRQGGRCVTIKVPSGG